MFFSVGVQSCLPPLPTEDLCILSRTQQLGTLVSEAFKEKRSPSLLFWECCWNAVLCVFRQLFSYITKERQTESLVEKLCQRFRTAKWVHLHLLYLSSSHLWPASFVLGFFHYSFLSPSCSISFVQDAGVDVWVIIGCFQCVTRDCQLKRVHSSVHLSHALWHLIHSFCHGNCLPIWLRSVDETIGLARLQSACDSCFIHTERKDVFYYTMAKWI